MSWAWPSSAPACLRYIIGKNHVNRRHISGKFLVYIMHISVIHSADLRRISGIAHEYHRQISRKSLANLRQFWTKSRGYLLKSYFTHLVVPRTCFFKRTSKIQLRLWMFLGFCNLSIFNVLNICCKNKARVIYSEHKCFVFLHLFFRYSYLK